MEWYDPNEKLPINADKQSIRCIAFCKSEFWNGIVEVYFSPYIGWRRCETGEMIEIMKWTYWENLDLQVK